MIINKINKNHILTISLVIVVILAMLILAGPLNSILTFNTKPAEKTDNLTLQITSEDDDGRSFEVPSTMGYGNEPGAWANLQINPSYSFGIRFINVSIPKNAQITKAYVKLYSIGIPGHNQVNCLIYGDNVDNALNLTAMGCLDRSGRIYTNKSVDWDAPAPYHVWVQTPSLASIIQEIIDRPGWEIGNPIALLFVTKNTDDTAVFANYDQGNPAELYIEWKIK